MHCCFIQQQPSRPRQFFSFQFLCKQLNRIIDPTSLLAGADNSFISIFPYVQRYNYCKIIVTQQNTLDIIGGYIQSQVSDQLNEQQCFLL